MKYLVSICLFLTLHLQAFESTNLQLLYSNSFDGNAFIYDTQDGKKTTVTFEHFRTFSYGDFFMFADIMDGKKFNNKDSELYVEFAPRISFSKLSGSSFSNTLVQDIFIATQANYGDEYRAYLYGLGIDFNIPLFNLFSINLYNKTENIYSDDTYQLTAVYTSKEYYGIHLNGFIDLTKRDFTTHTQVLYNLNTIINTQEKVYLGTEWIYYDYNVNGSSSKTSALQAMIKYSF